MYEFIKCVQRYHGNYKVRNFSCWNQFLCLAFAQLTHRESLQDIVCCLRLMEKKLYHMGFRGNISRSTLAEANENRDRRIYADFAQVLIHIAKGSYKDDEFRVSSWIIPSMLWIQRQSIFAFRCFPGGSFESRKEPSSCIPYWICVVIYHHIYK